LILKKNQKQVFAVEFLIEKKLHFIEVGITKKIRLKKTYGGRSCGGLTSLAICPGVWFSLRVRV
jgi:hypothetical protein